jgi:hypothetical protein
MTASRNTTVTTTVLILGALLAPLASAQEDSFENAIKNGTYKLNFRLRHEDVTQDNALRDASSDTLLTRLTLTSGKVHGLSGTLEVDNVSAIGSDHYDSFVLDEYRGRYSVIADPVGTEVNVAALGYELDAGNILSVGRQRIVHANQRFVGGVAWRQNEQTYDSFGYRRRAGALEIDYSYLWNVNRIFNGSVPSVQATDFDSDSHIVLAKYTQPWGSVSGFAYALDFANGAALSSLTYGASYAGKLGPVTVNATVAQQSDYGNNPLSYDAGFLSADAAINAGPVKLLAGYEVLGSDDGRVAFSTPLATLHLFQGWADMFLATPAAGIEDAYFTASGTVKGISWSASFHDYDSEEGGISYGKEWNVIANYSFNSMLSTQLKYASYDSASFAVDTDKLWLTLSLAF